MLILQISAQSCPLDTVLCQEGMEKEKITPSRFSFLTAMRIASFCKTKKIDVVVVYTLADAIAALSAKKIVEKNNIVPYSVVWYVTEKSKTIKSIPYEIAKDLDSVIFDSDITRNRWQTVRNIDRMTNHLVICPSEDTELLLSDIHEAETGDTLLYLGPIEKTSRLKEIIKTVLSSEEDIKLKVLGTGKASEVMPLVKLTRANKMSVEWAGDEYDIKEEISGAGGFFLNSQVPKPQEISMMKYGIPLVTEKNIKDWINPGERKKIIDRTKALYHEQYDIDRQKKLIREILKKIIERK